MIALDTNILVYARRSEAPHHSAARELLRKLSEGADPWAIPWPCIYEFLRIVTHPQIFNPPTPLRVALEDLDSLLASPTLSLLGQGPAHAGHLRRTIIEAKATGNLVHDAHIAALVFEHGVRELWSNDRDFSRFPGLRVRNPFDNVVHESVAKYAVRSLPAHR
jgi:toxin-antitoxin system PIN domain toxin